MHRVTVTVLLMLLGAVSLAGGAEDYAYALVQGRLHNSRQPAPLAGAQVSLIAGARSFETSSDQRGVFVFDKVPLGSYELWITAADGTPMQSASRAGDPPTGIRLRANRGTITPIRVEATADGVTFGVPKPETNWRKLWAEIGIFVGGAAVLAL